MLYLVGLGLCDTTDITVKGLEVVRRASRVYLEAYTSILTVGKEELVNQMEIMTRYLTLLRDSYSDPHASPLILMHLNL